jgi:Rad3-related DNA helicase
MTISCVPWRNGLTLAAALAIGCGGPALDPGPQAVSPAQDRAVAAHRVARSADLTVSVDSTEPAMLQVERLVRESGGFVERSVAGKGAKVSLQCKVPSAQLDRVLDGVAALGHVERRSVSGADVSGQYGDLEARLRSSIALRDRLKGLLDRASSIEEALRIEKEITRVQAEIETMQARLARLTSESELAALAVTLQRKQRLGPVAYVGHRLWRAVSGLFLIR